MMGLCVSPLYQNAVCALRSGVVLTRISCVLLAKDKISHLDRRFTQRRVYASRRRSGLAYLWLVFRSEEKLADESLRCVVSLVYGPDLTYLGFIFLKLVFSSARHINILSLTLLLG